MSAMQILITSGDYLDPDFTWYELYGSMTNLALSAVEASAEFQAVSYSTLFLRGGLVSGSVWYHWVRAVYSDGTVKSDLTALGPKTAIFVDTADIAAKAVTYAKIQDVSATSRLLGRKTAGAGAVEEMTGAEALAIINPPGGVLVHATMSADDVVSASGYHNLTGWNTFAVNVGTAMGTTNFTAPKTGWYRVTLRIVFDTIGSGELQIDIVNASTVAQTIFHDMGADFGGGYAVVSGSILIHATAGDLIYARIYSGSVSSYNIKSGAGPANSSFSVEWAGT